MQRASFCSVLFFCMAVALPAQTQQTSDTAAPTNNFAKHPVTFSGEIGPDGKTFVSDADHRIFLISNPETLRDISGQHVTLRCKLDDAHNNLQVLRVKVFSPQQSSARLGDAAFRR